jgi:hypothetical protein
MSLITIIGRGHSGTRAISHTLAASGVYMGSPLNISGDLLPPQAMYDACRVLARHVDWQGDMNWNWDRLRSMPIPDEFRELIDRYLHTVGESAAPHRGWKIPETTLVYPWIQRLYPDMKYIFWIRNPRDCILGKHLTDDLRDFGVPYPETSDERLRRAISWKYQYDLVKAMPQPAHWLEVRFEDFVLRQDETLARLEDFLGIKLFKIPVRPEAVNRWEFDQGTNYYDFFEPAMREYGYDIPEPGADVPPAADPVDRVPVH